MSNTLLPPIPQSLPKTQSDWAALVSVLQQWQQLLNGLLPPAPNGYSATFKTGQLRFTGPNGTITSDINFQVGTDLPNPTGAPAPALFLGSGGGSFTASISGNTMTVTSIASDLVIPLGATITGAGVATGTLVTAVPGGGDRSSSAGAYTVSVSQTVASETMAASVNVNILTDAPYDNFTPGNNIIASAGESDGAQPGGNWSTYGGGSASGPGGTNLQQGGTGATGGPAIVEGGGGTTVPGDAFVSGGQTGTQGANVHLIATVLGGAYGFLRGRWNSNIGFDFIATGAPSGGHQPVGLYLYSGNGVGTANGQPLVTNGATGAMQWFTGGFTGSITFGTGHTMTVANGLITGYS